MGTAIKKIASFVEQVLLNKALRKECPYLELF